MSHVFISYVKENEAQVENLLEALTQAGVEVWVDRRHIDPGARWQMAIREAVVNGAFFLACFSKEYNLRSRSYMNEEITLALEELRQRPANRAWFIPVKLSECEIPDLMIGGGQTLHSIQWLELYKDWDRGIKKLLSVIKPPAPTPPALTARNERSLLSALNRSLPAPKATGWSPINRGHATWSFITLFILEPRPPQLVSRVLLNLYGWPYRQPAGTHPSGALSFHQTLNARERNEWGFGIKVDYTHRKIVMSFDASKVHERHAEWKASVRERVGLGELAPQPYWDFDDVFKKAGIRLYEQFFPFAEMLRESSREYHQYNSNLIIQALLVKAIERGDVYIDLRLRTGRNFGTGFKLRRDKLSELNDGVRNLV